MYGIQLAIICFNHLGDLSLLFLRQPLKTINLLLIHLIPLRFRYLCLQAPILLLPLFLLSIRLLDLPLVLLDDLIDSVSLLLIDRVPQPYVPFHLLLLLNHLKIYLPGFELIAFLHKPIDVFVGLIQLGLHLGDVLIGQHFVQFTIQVLQFAVFFLQLLELLLEQLQLSFLCVDGGQAIFVRSLVVFCLPCQFCKFAHFCLHFLMVLAVIVPELLLQIHPLLLIVLDLLLQFLAIILQLLQMRTELHILRIQYVVLLVQLATGLLQSLNLLLITHHMLLVLPNLLLQLSVDLDQLVDLLERLLVPALESVVRDVGQPRKTN